MVVSVKWIALSEPTRHFVPINRPLRKLLPLLGGNGHHIEKSVAECAEAVANFIQRRTVGRRTGGAEREDQVGAVRREQEGVVQKRILAREPPLPRPGTDETPVGQLEGGVRASLKKQVVPLPTDEVTRADSSFRIESVEPLVAPPDAHAGVGAFEQQLPVVRHRYVAAQGAAPDNWPPIGPAGRG